MGFGAPKRENEGAGVDCAAGWPKREGGAAAGAGVPKLKLFLFPSDDGVSAN